LKKGGIHLIDEIEERVPGKRNDHGIFPLGLTHETEDMKLASSLDSDWQLLVKEAMASGKSKSQFKQFLELFRD
jgi:hypothetical protein